MSHQVNLGVVSRTLEALLERDGRSVAMRDPATGAARIVGPDLAASRDGLLPVFLVAADAVWRETTERSFGVELRREPKTLLGYRAEGVSGGPFASLMLSMIEAIEQVARPNVILVNDFNQLWREIGQDMASTSGPRPTARPSPAGG